MEGPWDWPSIERRPRIVRRAECAITVTPAWGVSAAPSVRGPLGRGGPWEVEARDVERAYGPDRTLHVSLEEFARTLPVRRETRERLREGGIPSRALRARVAAARRRGEVAAFDAAFRRFRAFERANVLHLFATFRPDPSFAREFPDALLTCAKDPRDIAMVRQSILAFFEAAMVEGELVVPYDRQYLLNDVHAAARVLAESYDEAGARVRVLTDQATLARFQRALG